LQGGRKAGAIHTQITLSEIIMINHFVIFSLD